jgi:epoxyqueuosine reductase QueG
MRDKIVETLKSAILCYGKDRHLDTMWKEPVIEIISANDERLKMLKEAVSPEHLMPRDILPDAKSIISFFIPFQESIVKSNMEGTMASTQWATAYMETNTVIKTINDRIETLMEQNGYKAGKIPATHNFDVKKLISNWSHRHIAFIAGMGTFGINNMLITKNGCCGRLGSILINYELPEYEQSRETKENCLNKQGRSCGMCQRKCVVNAYGHNTYDRHKCYEQCLKNMEYHKQLGYADICGKCLVGLPCSTGCP